MSNHDNHRRGEEKRSEHGPRYEGGGSDNSAVARARKRWRRLGARKFRRTGQMTGVMHKGRRVLHDPATEE